MSRQKLPGPENPMGVAFLVGSSIGAAIVIAWLKPEQVLGISLLVTAITAFGVWFLSKIYNGYRENQARELDRSVSQEREAWNVETLAHNLEAQLAFSALWNQHSAFAEVVVGFHTAIVSETGANLSLQITSPVPMPHRIALNDATLVITDGRGQEVALSMPKLGVVLSFDGKTCSRFMPLPSEISAAALAALRDLVHPFVHVVFVGQFELELKGNKHQGQRAASVWIPIGSR